MEAAVLQYAKNGNLLSSFMLTWVYRLLKPLPSNADKTILGILLITAGGQNLVSKPTTVVRMSIWSMLGESRLLRNGPENLASM
jgi:hypothetical protein